MRHLVVIAGILALVASVTLTSMAFQARRVLKQRFVRRYFLFTLMMTFYLLMSVLADYFEVNISSAIPRQLVFLIFMQRIMPIAAVTFLILAAEDISSSVWKVFRVGNMVMGLLVIAAGGLTVVTMLLNHGLDLKIVLLSRLYLWSLVMTASAFVFIQLRRQPRSPAAIRFGLLSLVWSLAIALLGQLGLHYLYHAVIAHSLIVGVMGVKILFFWRHILPMAALTRDNRRLESLGNELFDQYQFTQREREILIELGKGISNKEIAQNMGISHHTVKEHMHNIFSKTGVSSRLQLLQLFF